MLKRLFEKYSGLRYVLSSASSFVVDTILYYVFNHFLFGGLFAMSDVKASAVSLVAARVLSSFYNFNVNNFLVFRHGREDYGKSLLKYYCVCVPQLLASELLLNGVIALFGIKNDMVKTAVKVLVDGILFVLSYFIQNKWVFSKETDKKTTSDN